MGKEEMMNDKIEKTVRIRARCACISRINPSYKLQMDQKFEIAPGRDYSVTEAEIKYIAKETSLLKDGSIYPVSMKELEVALGLSSDQLKEQFPLAFSDSYIDMNVKGDKASKFIEFLENTNAGETVLSYLKNYVEKTESIQSSMSGDFKSNLNSLIKRKLFTLKENWG